MGARRIDAPDGRHWTVRRQWAPRLTGRGLRARVDRARRGDRDRSGWLDLLELPDWVDGGGISVIAAGILFFVVMVVLLLLGLPPILALIDVVLVVALVLGGVVGRVLFRRPWTVEALDETGERVTRQVVGWAARGRVRDEMASEAAHGRVPDQEVAPTRGDE